MLFNIDGTISHSIELLQQLDELILNDLPNLTQIINEEIVKLYQDLKILQVKNCESLEWLPISQVLKNMEITDCMALHKIVIIHEEEGRRGKTTFSQLKDVSLINLLNLSIAFPIAVEFPSLETLKIENCPSLKTFVEKSNEEKDHPELDNSNYFFPNSLSLDKLKVLYVMNQPVEELWHYNCPSESFCDLEKLTLRNNKKLLSVFSPAMIVRFNKLKNLTLEKCEFLAEVFILEGDKPNHDNQEMLPQLRVLAMSNLSKLTCFWNKEPQVPFFLNLVSLFIIHCHCLKSLFSLSQAQNLKKLKILRLCNCEKVEEVISSDKGEKVATIFPKMKCLVLKDLPKLVNFCQEGGCFNWPNLQTVRVNNIPSIKTFLRDDLNTPLLKSVYITFAKKLWLGNLNKTISYMHNNPGV
uniref:Disease resistance protein RPS2 n=2 Tax=Cajanus cajan TaxID=3821 RepID=A0A151R3V0_CAJCA|nr:Disease resistance protein RPS2 [Cajanus cajan]